MREVTIKPVLNGFVVQVGCQAVVFESKMNLILELSKYLDDPYKIEKRYLEESINAGKLKGLSSINRIGNSAPPMPPPAPPESYTEQMAAEQPASAYR